MNNTKEITSEDIDREMASFCPFGYRDIEVALKAINEASEGRDELYEICNDFVESTDMKMEDIDPVYCVYDHYHQVARTDIEAETGKDISNDAPYHGVNVSGNYMCTTFDGTQADTDALKELINTIPEEKRSLAVKWLLNELN